MIITEFLTVKNTPSVSIGNVLVITSKLLVILKTPETQLIT